MTVFLRPDDFLGDVLAGGNLRIYRAACGMRMRWTCVASSEICMASRMDGRATNTSLENAAGPWNGSRARGDSIEAKTERSNLEDGMETPARVIEGACSYDFGNI